MPTIDTNIEFLNNDIYKLMNMNIIEFKIPFCISLELANKYLEEINTLIDTKLTFQSFSKSKYYFYDSI